MNIMNLGSIPNITNQITTGAPQEGFRCDPGAMVSAAESQLSKISQPLIHLDISGRTGYREDYSVRDAAESLWKQENSNFNLFDPASIQRMQDRVRSGLSTISPTEEELTAYIEKLRESGLDGTVDWSGLSREFEAFKTTTPEELSDGLDYLASRYMSVMDKLQRNFSGEELTAQMAKLEAMYQNGKAGMIDNYTQFLQDNLGISDSDARAVKDSFSTLLDERVDAYRGALEKVHGSLSGPDSVWLKDHDAYIASRLRASGAEGQSQARYSAEDLAAAGKIAQLYRTEIFNASFNNRNEATLALNLAMADMKAEAMIEKGLVGKDMASLLRGSRDQGHQNALDVLDRALARRESTLSPGEPKGTFAPVDSSVFRGIYNAVMSAYKQNGGNAADAIRAGASYGQTATAQATAKNPKALRWGIGIAQYWKDFYTTPDARELSLLDKQVDALLAQVGRTSDRGSSTYQKYVNDWQEFLASIGSGMDTRG